MCQACLALASRRSGAAWPAALEDAPDALARPAPFRAVATWSDDENAKPADAADASSVDGDPAARPG